MNEDKASRYQRLSRQASLANVALTGGLLLVLSASGAGASVRDTAAGLTGGWIPATAAVFSAAVTLLHGVLCLPLAFFQDVALERRYGLSRQSVGRWWLEHLRVLTFRLVLTVSAGVMAIVLLQAIPDWWWLVAAITFAAALVALTQLAPMLLVSSSGGLQPLGREALVARLIQLANKAEIPVVGVFEWPLGATTSKANAALTGIGQTRRILVSDTLLADHSDDEIEVILAHELAHHVHHDIWGSIAVKAAVALVACFVTSRVLFWMQEGIGVARTGDVSVLPLLALSFGSVWFALTPMMHAVSRAHERRADDYALAMTGNAAAFVSVIRRLAERNLADHRPPRIVEYLFHTHPPVGARIAAAHAWNTERTAAARDA